MDVAGDTKAAKFGAFELDLEAGELHKNGLKVRLQDQPYRLLALLVKRQGEVVSRDELREKLWPADTYVDFDNSLNTAASKLREALGDSAANPRFIETLPRRGYRFLCPVELVGAGVNGSSEIEGRAALLDFPDSRTDTDRVRQLTKRIRRERVAFSAVAALLVVSAAFWLRPPDSPSDLPLRRFALQINGGSVSPVISPNGKHIAYAADQSIGFRIWTRMFRGRLWTAVCARVPSDGPRTAGLWPTGRPGTCGSYRARAAGEPASIWSVSGPHGTAFRGRRTASRSSPAGGPRRM